MRPEGRAGRNICSILFIWCTTCPRGKTGCSQSRQCRSETWMIKWTCSQQVGKTMLTTEASNMPRRVEPVNDEVAAVLWLMLVGAPCTWNGGGKHHRGRESGDQGAGEPKSLRSDISVTNFLRRSAHGSLPRVLQVAIEIGSLRKMRDLIFCTTDR